MRKILRRCASLVTGLALALTIGIASGQPASAASGCTTTFSSYTTVKPGSRGARAKAAQCLLRAAGYTRVRADGSFSAADAAQLKRFQRARKLPATGRVDARAWTALLARGSRPTLRAGHSGASVRRLQRALTAAGRKVPVTGYFGTRTRNAVMSVQRAQGWRASGTASSNVWRALQAGNTKVRVSVARKAKAKAPRRSRASAAARGAKALAFAKRQLGDRYRYGGTGPNAWDCSGLTGGAWKAAGIKLPRTSQAQYRFGKKVSKSNLRPGDLVFFYRGISHVAIYAGNGYVVHASNPSRPVNKLKMKYVPYMGARRPA